MIQKTWDEFWGEFFLTRFYEANPERQHMAEERARWIWRHLALSEGSRVLDLGCGNGMYDLCLARMGANVTAVDRIRSVLDAARKQAGELPISFVQRDIRDLSYPPGSFECITLFETVGLMGKADDRTIILNSRKWLCRGGRIVVDCPAPPDENHGEKTWEFPDGTLELEWTYDRKTRLQHLAPLFTTDAGETIELHDRYDISKGDHTGVLRYFYPQSELTELMVNAGFEVSELPHYVNKNGVILLGVVGPAPQ